MTNPPRWECFHCGYVTSDEAEAKDHFGESVEDKALCQSWNSLDPRLREYLTDRIRRGMSL